MDPFTPARRAPEVWPKALTGPVYDLFTMVPSLSPRERGATNVMNRVFTYQNQMDDSSSDSGVSSESTETPEQPLPARPRPVPRRRRVTTTLVYPNFDEFAQGVPIEEVDFDPEQMDFYQQYADIPNNFLSASSIKVEEENDDDAQSQPDQNAESETTPLSSNDASSNVTSPSNSPATGTRFYKRKYTSDSQNKPWKCSYPGCSKNFKTAQRINGVSHVRMHHFKVPKTVKDQEKLQLFDPEDPMKYIYQ